MPKIDRLFDELIAKRGSDLHVGVGQLPLVRARGELVPLREGVVDRAEVEGLLFEILSPLQRRKIEADLDLDFTYTYEEKARFRASYFFTTSGLSASFRFIPTTIHSLTDLGCPDFVRKLAERRSGLVVVAGLPGSGTSTTLAAMVDHVNQTRTCHILTLEEPVEFVHESRMAQVTHREIPTCAPSLRVALRSAERENADVILIGELRDGESLKLALDLASSGILVFAGVTASSSVGAIDCLIAAVVAEEQPRVRGLLGESLAGVVAQRLLKTKDGHGRVAAFELLGWSSATASLIREDRTFQIASVLQAGQSAGMQSMDSALERLMVQNRISPETALDVASDREAFARLVARGGPSSA